MVQINFAQKTVNVKIVYYGPGMSGKTTNLEVVHQRAPDSNRGDLTSISTDGDRTLFFDYMPLELGTVAGMRTCFQVYTVPGQVYYNSTRKLVLQGVDGVIFVADSSASMLEQNLESFRNLEENLNEYGKSLSTMPHVVQFNKRDLPDAMSVEELNKHMNPHNAPTFEAIANSGQGVFPTLKSLAAQVLRSIMQETGGESKPSMAPAKAGPGSNAPAPLPSAAAPQPAKAGRQPTSPAAQPAQRQRPAPVAAQRAPAQSPSLKMKSNGGATQTAAPKRRSAADVMGQAPAPAPAARQRTRPQSQGNANAGARRSRPKSAAATQQVSAPKKRGGAFFTGAFIVLAAGAGAVLAWFALKVL